MGKFKRWKPVMLGFCLVLAVAALLAVHYQDLLWPAPKFDHYLLTGPFKVYSDREVRSMAASLEQAQTRLQVTELYDPWQTHEIFLCHESQKYGHFAKAIGKSTDTQGFHLHPLGHTFINLSFIREMSDRNMDGIKYNLLEGNPAHIIAHEITHELIEHELGFRTMRQIPSWKLEGYCEYAASLGPKRQDPKYNFESSMKDFLSGRYDKYTAGRQFYLRSELIVEYLLDEARLSFNSLMTSDIDPEGIWNEMQQKYP